MAFTKNSKGAIDLVVPSLGSIATAFYFITKQKDRDVKFLVLILILVFALLYAITTQVTKAILIAGEKPADVPLTGDKSSGINSTTGESVPGGFDTEGWVDRLKRDVYAPVLGISIRDADLYAKMVLFGNDDLIKMWNLWKDKYFEEHGETMTEAIAGEWFVYGSAVYSNKETIISRLRKLGLR